MSSNNISILIWQNLLGNLNLFQKPFAKTSILNFGKTVVCKIDVTHPILKFQNFRHIFIEFEQFKKFITLNRSAEYEIFAKVLFKDEKVKSLTTDFKDKLERVYNERYQDYDPSDDYDPREDDDYYDVLREGDGQIALNLTSITMPN